MKRVRIILACILCLIAVTSTAVGVRAAEKPAPTNTCTSSQPFCYHGQFSEALEQLDAAAVPKIATPAWLVAQQTAPAAGATVVTYTVATRGVVTADTNEFAALFNETLNSSEGWSRLGVRFEQVAAGGRFTAWLSEASQMPTFSASGCDPTLSCRVGNDVVINETRWLNGSDAWNAAGGSLLDYRRMVVNHETGHWLGHGHRSCGGAGSPAPVMQQQSVDMQGCTPNSWPLAGEMYAPNLGIRS